MFKVYSLIQGYWVFWEGEICLPAPTMDLYNAEPLRHEAENFESDFWSDFQGMWYRQHDNRCIGEICNLEIIELRT